MKEGIVDGTKLCAVILLTLLNFVCGGLRDNAEDDFEPVPADQVPSILTMISYETQTNYDRVRTWEGAVDASIGRVYEGPEAERVLKSQINDVRQVPEKVERLAENTIDFVVNYEEELVFYKKSHRSSLKYTDPNSGRILGSKSIVGSTTTIVTPEYRITSIPAVMRDDAIVIREAVKEKRSLQENCPTCIEGTFDPRYETIDGSAFRGTFLVLVNYIKKHGKFSIDGESLRIEERVSGDTTEYRLEIPSLQANSGECVFTTMMFSSAKGFNITLSETRSADGKLYQKAIWDYERVDGVYLPKRTMIQTFKGENAELTYERECVFTNFRLNQAVSENTFSYRNLGLRNGDKFIDRIADMEYSYENGELAPVNVSNK